MKAELRPAGTGGPRRCGDGGVGVSLKVSLKVSKFSLKVSMCTMKVSLKVREGGQVVVFVSGKNGERNPAFGELSAQMRGTGVEHASRATCKTRRKDASTEQPKKPGGAAGFW